MKVARIVALPFRYKPWRRQHLRLLARDLLTKGGQPELPSRLHLEAAIDWLCRAQDVRDDCADRGGVAAGWSFEDGWLPSYPETSGYIVETFVAAAEVLGRPELVGRAARVIDWELSIQQSDGAFPGHFGERGSHPVVFNTGQIMHGMLAGYLQLKRDACLESAVRAGHWLARHQDDDGCWRQFEHHAVPHTYNTRGTWALLATGLLAGDAKLVDSAKRHLEWALRQQTNSGWFENNAFTPDRYPFTHTIAYAIRGFIECGALAGDERYVAAAKRAASGVASAQRSDGWLPGTLDRNWQSRVQYACLTGIAQMALCWMRLDQEADSVDFRAAASNAIRYVKRQQCLADADPIVRGGIAGSAPIWGRYSMFEYPNWAAKFFADALMIEMTGAPIPPLAIRKSTLSESRSNG
jgi:uncharacterized protein YyaL (SSP411 family)